MVFFRVYLHISSDKKYLKQEIPLDHSNTPRGPPFIKNNPAQYSNNRAGQNMTLFGKEISQS